MSLRGLQQTTTLATVQERFGIGPTSLSTLSEAAYIVDTTRFHEVLITLGAQLRPQLPLAEQAALAHLIAVDGSLLPALPRMAWALWQDDQYRAAKMHVAFAVLRHGPVDVTVTAGHSSERAEWRRLVQPGGFYVVDRGYGDYSLFQDLHDLPCHVLCRVQDNAAYEGQEERARTLAAVHAGVVRDVLLRRLGTPHHTRLLAAALPPGAGRNGQNAARWDPRRGPRDASVGPRRGVARPRISVSLGGGGVFLLGQICPGLPAFAEPGVQRGAPSGVRHLYRQPVDQPVGWTGAGQADV
jgi:DDE family transposase